jgi:hypothetical protein
MGKKLKNPFLNPLKILKRKTYIFIGKNTLNIREFNRIKTLILDFWIGRGKNLFFVGKRSPLNLYKINSLFILLDYKRKITLIISFIDINYPLIIFRLKFI